MLSISRPHTIWKVTTMEEFISNPLPVIFGGTGIALATRENLTHHDVPNMVAEGNGVEWCVFSCVPPN